jgi:hypothetical protein
MQRTALAPTRRLLWLLAIPTFHSLGCVVPDDDDPAGLNEDVSEIKNVNPVAPSDLLGMVEVTSAVGSCSGMVISETAVLTAAHCVCTENYVGGNVCHSTATVFFRPDLSGASGGHTPGTVIWNPNYNPSWTGGHIEGDLAIITIPFGSRPAHAQPFEVASAYTPIGAQLMVAGFGLTGQDCEGPSGTLNWDDAVVDSYEDDGGVVALVDDEWCSGDSGGALLLADGSASPNRLVGVISSTHPITGTSKATPTWSYFGWIAANVSDLDVPLVPKFGAEQQTYTGLNFGLPSTWEPITGDFNGDGRTDYARVGATGAWVFIAQLGSGFTTGFQVYSGLNFGQPSSWQTITGDFNGDGRGDYARLGATGAWVFSGQPSGGFTQGFQVYVGGLNFGLPSSWKPITGDFNGDGIGDYGRVGATGAWFFLGQPGGGWIQGFQAYAGLNFGQPSSWQTITADFNGDGKTDYARLGATGAWIFTVQPSGFFAQSFQVYSGLNFGLPSQWEPITGDFDGDGRQDYARVGATGAWFFMSTASGFTQSFQDYGGLDFGAPSPWTTITGDFNGDGFGDYARLGSTGAWVFSGSATSFATVFQVYAIGGFGLPSQWQTITGRFNGGTKTGYARLGSTTAWVFRGL